MQTIQLNVNEQEALQILNALAVQPWNAVNALMGNLQGQIQQQAQSAQAQAAQPLVQQGKE